jgi:PBP1b-binding outer membrane lipoprotein LpoB
MDTKKIIAILLLAMVALTMLFGCFEQETGTKVTNQAEANKTLNDASTDLSGVKQTLDDVENELTQ